MHVYCVVFDSIKICYYLFYTTDKQYRFFSKYVIINITKYAKSNSFLGCFPLKCTMYTFAIKYLYYYNFIFCKYWVLRISRLEMKLLFRIQITFVLCIGDAGFNVSHRACSTESCLMCRLNFKLSFVLNQCFSLAGEGSYNSSKISKIPPHWTNNMGRIQVDDNVYQKLFKKQSNGSTIVLHLKKVKHLWIERDTEEPATSLSVLVNPHKEETLRAIQVQYSGNQISFI